MKALTSSKLLALLALVVFVLAAIGSWPDSLSDDIRPLELGLALLAGSLIVD